MTINQKPYHLLAITAVLAALFSLLPLHWAADINLHNAYYVMYYSTFLRFWAIWLLVFWVINMLLSGWLKSLKMSWIHTLSILAAFACAHLLLIPWVPLLYSQSASWLARWSYFIGLLPALLTVVALLIGVASLLINFSISVRRFAGGK